MLIAPPSGQEVKSTVVSEAVQWYSQSQVGQQYEWGSSAGGGQSVATSQ